MGRAENGFISALAVLCVISINLHGMGHDVHMYS